MAKRVLKYKEETNNKSQRPKMEPLTPTKLASDTHATIEAVIASVSPMKNSKTHFFDEELTDGDTVIRMVGFDDHQRDALNTFMKQKMPVAIKNCHIQLSKFTQKYEVVLKGYTTIEQSEMKFDISDMDTLGSDKISLSELSTKEYDRVTVKVKIIRINKPEKVGKNKTKQDVAVSDPTGVANLTLWESDINTLKIDQSYQLNRLIVRTYKGKRMLSLSAGVTSVIEIEDIVEDSCDLDKMPP